MKLVKIAIILPILIGISLYGCGRRTSSANNSKQQEQSEISNGKDWGTLENEIASLNTQLDVVKRDVDNIKKEFKDITSKNIWAIIIAFSSALISIIAIYTIIALRKELKGQVQSKENLDDQIKKLEEHLNNLKSQLENIIRKMSGASSDNGMILLPSKPKQDTNSIHRPRIEPTKQPQTQNFSSSKMGYFKQVISGEGGNGYFKKLFDTSDEEVRFSAEIFGTEAKFQPMHISSIKSFDQMDLAVECQGIVKSEAGTMSIIEPGRAKKDGERWIITAKAVVYLKK